MNLIKYLVKWDLRMLLIVIINGAFIGPFIAKLRGLEFTVTTFAVISIISGIVIEVGLKRMQKKFKLNQIFLMIIVIEATILVLYILYFVASPTVFIYSYVLITTFAPVVVIAYQNKVKNYIAARYGRFHKVHEAITDSYSLIVNKGAIAGSVFIVLLQQVTPSYNVVIAVAALIMIIQVAIDIYVYFKFIHKIK